MNRAQSQKNMERLTQAGFDGLLQWLDPNDREQAGEKYERVRTKLIRFFEWKGASSPEDHADETINRVAGRIAAGEVIHTNDPYKYFCGVAYRLMQEVWRKPQEQPLEPDAFAKLPAAPPAAPGEFSRVETCLDRCLQGISPYSRELVMEYYQAQGGGQVDHRQKVAERWQLSLSTLRVRCHRIRERLQVCMVECIKQAPGE